MTGLIIWCWEVQTWIHDLELAVTSWAGEDLLRDCATAPCQGGDVELTFTWNCSGLVSSAPPVFVWSLDSSNP